MSEKTDGKIGYWEVVAIGIGGMVGGGIFAVLGLAVELAHGGTPLAFAIAGLVALMTAYSYTKLSVAFPSQGGTVTFLDRAFGSGVLTGGLNVLLWLSYVVMLSLYAFAFGSYGATFLPDAWQGVGKHVLISLSILGIAGLNLLSA
ncbi:MAG: amino acid permease [Anaerolineae bacterium]|nr:amino acid permease [Anaerolineae bacterium]